MDLIMTSSVRKPNNTLVAKTFTLNTGLDFHMQVYAELRKEKLKGWAFYGVNQQRGRCYFQERIVTIPLFAFKRNKLIDQEGYLTWYIAHEISHIKAGPNAHHGPEFMAELKAICPVQYLFHETSYKPQNAKAAGIANKKGESIVQVGNKQYQIDLDDLL